MTDYTFDQLFLFLSSTAATFVGSDGFIQLTQPSRNLFLQTQRFQVGAWTKDASTAVPNAATAPDGTPTANKITATATTVFHSIRQSVTQTVATYTYSMYAKAAEYSKLILADATAGTWSATFNLATGATITTGGTAVLSSSIQATGNGWYRCAVTFTGAAASVAHAAVGYPDTGATLNNFGASYTGDGLSGVYLWGAQLELGSTVTAYTRNNAGRFPPRFDYDPVTLAPKGILIEEQRTNLLLQSETFDSATWNKFNVTVTANAAVSPDGASDADALVEDATTGSHICQQFLAYTSGTAYTFSTYVKAGTRTWVQIALPPSAFTASTGGFFNLTGAGSLGAAAGTPTSRTITAVGNGWYRITVTATATATASGNTFIGAGSADGTSSYAGVAGAEALYLYGAQLEAGAFATSYIPTVASQVTRNVDQYDIQAPMFTFWYNQNAGTLVFEGSSFATNNTSTGIPGILVSDGANNNSNSHRVLAFSDYWEATTANGGVVQSDLFSFGTYIPNVTAKVAYAYATNNFAASINGGVAITDVSGTVPVTMTRMISGANSISASSYLNGHIRSVRYYQTRLSDAQLRALTEPALIPSLNLDFINSVYEV